MFVLPLAIFRCKEILCIVLILSTSLPFRSSIGNQQLSSTENSEEPPLNSRPIMSDFAP